MAPVRRRFYESELFLPEFRQLVEAAGIDLTGILSPVIPVRTTSNKTYEVVPMDRQELRVASGDKQLVWRTESLRKLMRGDRQPPVLGDTPNDYQEVFQLLDFFLCDYSRYLQPPSDAELREVFSILRRRPDGKSSGTIHDALWQMMALLLATRPLSQAEYEAIVARMERSCRTFETHPTSRNFIATLLATTR